MRRTRDFVDALRSVGRYTFNAAELRDAVGGTDLAREASVRRLKKKGLLSSPRKGFYFIVPNASPQEHSCLGELFIDDLMKHIGRPYYVGLMSAAALHVDHIQKPAKLHVVTDKPTRPVAASLHPVEFYARKQMEDWDATEMQDRPTTIRVSTPEQTLVDLIRYSTNARSAKKTGRLEAVMPAVKSLATVVDGNRLVDAVFNAQTTTFQRLCYIIWRVGPRRLRRPLLVHEEEWRDPLFSVALSPTMPGLRTSHRWNVTVDDELFRE